MLRPSKGDYVLQTKKIIEGSVSVASLFLTEKKVKFALMAFQIQYGLYLSPLEHKVLKDFLHPLRLSAEPAQPNRDTGSFRCLA